LGGEIDGTMVCVSVLEILREWGKGLMRSVYRAFSNLVADNQYATLGLLLLGVLARVRSVIRPFGRDVKEDESLIGNESGVVSQLGSGDGNDLGEVVEREEVGASCDMERSSKVAHADHDDEDENMKSKKLKKKKRKSTGAEDASKDMAAKSTPSKRPKKKRKKGDAFDDLFSSLI
jgi:ribonuclease MRP protein subunit RMP1